MKTVYNILLYVGALLILLGLASYLLASGSSAGVQWFALFGVVGALMMFFGAINRKKK